jgi:hypothetical protein
MNGLTYCVLPTGLTCAPKASSQAAADLHFDNMLRELNGVFGYFCSAEPELATAEFRRVGGSDDRRDGGLDDRINEDPDVFHPAETQTRPVY